MSLRHAFSRIGLLRQVADKFRLAEAPEHDRLATQARGSHGCDLRKAAGQAVVMDSMATARERLASGDLTARLEQIFAADYQGLRGAVPSAAPEPPKRTPPPLRAKLRLVVGGAAAARKPVTDSEWEEV